MELQRLNKLFADLYNGNPWTAIKLTDLLEGITATEAAQRPIQNANTIWQLVQHCLGWRENVLRKIQGENFKSPEDNYLSNPTDTSEKAWNELLLRFKRSEVDWEQYLSTLQMDNLNSGYLPSQNEWTNYEVIHGLLHHDNYHFGQISMLKKLVQPA